MWTWVSRYFWPYCVCIYGILFCNQVMLTRHRVIKLRLSETRGLTPVCFAFSIKTVKLCSSRHPDQRVYSHKKLPRAPETRDQLFVSRLSTASIVAFFSPLCFALLHADKKCKSGHFLFLKMSLIQIIIQHLLKKRRPVSLHKSVRCHGNGFLLLLKVPT